MIQIIPSILSVDFSRLQECLSNLEEKEVSAVHFDVMDNHFVPNLTFGAKFIRDLRAHSRLPFDVHLMIDAPEKSLESFLAADAQVYTVHVEATEAVGKISQAVREAQKLFGLALKPQTPVERLVPYLTLIDRVLLMTVEPGFAGQRFMPSCLPKIRECRKLITHKNLNIDIAVDGGINQSTSQKVIDAGANILVMGTGFFQANP